MNFDELLKKNNEDCPRLRAEMAEAVAAYRDKMTDIVR